MNFHTSLLIKLQTVTLSVVILQKAIMSYLKNRGMFSLSTIFSDLLLYFSLLLSITIIIRTGRFQQFISALAKVIAVFALIYVTQKVFCPESHVEEFIYPMMIVGIGGFIIGYSIIDFKALIRWHGIFAAVGGSLLVTEPLTNKLLGLSNMSLGYTLVPLCVFMILYCNYNRSLIIKIVAGLLSLSVMLFTSRGCGLTIIAFFLIMLIWEGRISKKRLFGIIAILSVVIICSISYFSSRNIDVATGSFLGKINEGMLGSDNGREYLQAYELELIASHPLTGVGIGVDRDIIGTFTDNYPFAHNIILEMVMNFGIVIAALLLFLYFNNIYYALRVRTGDTVQMYIIASLCYIFIRLLFSDSYLNNMYGIMSLLGVAINYNLSLRRVKYVKQ